MKNKWFLPLLMLFLFAGYSFSGTVIKQSPDSDRITQNTAKKVAIVLDPAFGGEETGAVGKYGLKEKDVVLDISLHIEKLFSGIEDIKVYCTRNEDKTVSQNEREGFIKTCNPSLLVRLRLKASDEEEASGFSANYARKNEESKKLAKIITDNFSKKVLTPNEGIKPTDIYENIRIPCVEIFLGYISNPNIEINLRSMEVKKTFARTIYDSIMQYLGRTVENSK